LALVGQGRSCQCIVLKEKALPHSAQTGRLQRHLSLRRSFPEPAIRTMRSI